MSHMGQVVESVVNSYVHFTQIEYFLISVVRTERIDERKMIKFHMIVCAFLRFTPSFFELGWVMTSFRSKLLNPLTILVGIIADRTVQLAEAPNSLPTNYRAARNEE
jgi:hypothetical protein